MDDIDDYFGDSFVLDDNDLAVLAEAEETYTLRTTQIPHQNAPPPLKRQKTSHQWPTKALPQPPIDIEAEAPGQEPEIYLRADGTYGVRGEPKRQRAASSGQRARTMASDAPPNEDSPIASGFRQTDRLQNTHSRVIASNGVVHPKLGQPSQHSSKTITARPTSRQTDLSHVSQPRPQTARPSSGQTATLNNSQAPSRRPAPQPQRNDTVISEVVARASMSSGPSEIRLQKEVAALRAQLEELNRENIAVQQSLKEALDARYAKEGEVTILRKGMEKVTLDHAADLERLKAAKEAAETVRAQMQKEMKEEMERLRTQFIFKQHELETSARKPSWSTRSKRSIQLALATPLQVPLAMRSWGASAAGPSTLIRGSPSRPAFRRTQAKSPSKPPAAVDPFFPGFENSFLPSSPARSPATRKSNVPQLQNQSQIPRLELRDQTDTGTGKQRETEKQPAMTFTEIFSQTTGLVFPLNSIPPSPRRSPRKQEFATDFEMNDTSPSRKSHVRDSSPLGETGDTSFALETDLGDTDMEHQDEEFEGMQWRDELHRLLFTHTSKVSPSLTFQLLLSTTLPADTPDTLKDAYQAACAAILEAIGTKYKYVAYEEFALAIGAALVRLTRILVEARCTNALIAALDLLNSLMLFIPLFTAALITGEEGDNHRESEILMIVCDVIREQLQAPQVVGMLHGKEMHLQMFDAVISFLESVCWTLSDDLVERLGVLARKDRVIMTLLNEKQPPVLVSKAVRLLVLLVSHFSLARTLLSFPDPDIPVEHEPPKDYSRIPVLERLCTLLIDSTSLSSATDECASLTLNTISLLSIASPESLTLLLESSTLIPSLVQYLTYMTTLLWEDDETVMASPSAASASVQNHTYIAPAHYLDPLPGYYDLSVVHTTKQTLHLLYYLVFKPQPIFNLRHKLHHAPRQFNGLTHQFIVMIGRLSYADAPEWLEPELRAEIEAVAEPARDLMDLIVEGPEGDSIWVAYQGESATEEDDEEIEARQLNANELE